MSESVISIPPSVSEKALDQLEAFGVDRLPVEISNVAKGDAIRKLVERLIEEYSFTPAGAAAIAGSVVDPAELRVRLKSTIGLRVPGGTLFVLPATVWTLRVGIDCTNPRVANKQQYQFGWREGVACVPPIRQATTVPNHFELMVQVRNREHFEGAMRQALDEVRTGNPTVMASVPQQGVMAAAVLTVMHVEHQESGESNCALVTIDGSSRLTACQVTLSTQETPISPADAFYKYGETRDFVGFTKKIRAEFNTLDPKRFDEQEAVLRRNRCMTMPAYIVVGYLPDRLPKPQTFETAVQAYRGLCHVAPPTPWGDAGQRDAMSEGVLTQLHSEGVSNASHVNYLAGIMLPDEAAKAGYSIDMDVRAAHILRLFSMPEASDRRTYRAVSRGICAMRAGSERAARATGSLRAEVAAELMIRPIRTWFPSSYVDTVRSALERGLTCAIFKDAKWGISGLGPDELLEKGIDELEATGVPGSSAVELAAMGAFWMCVTQNIRRASSQRQSEGDELPNWSEPAAIIKKLGESVWGLRIFHRAVVDGRHFTPTLENPNATAARAAEAIYAIDQDGNSILGPTNVERKMDSAFVKTDVLAEEPEAEPEGISSEKKYTQLWARFSHNVDELQSTFNALKTVRDSLGRRLIDAQGLLANEGRQYSTVLNYLAMQTSILTEKNEQAALDLQERSENAQNGGE